MAEALALAWLWVVRMSRRGKDARRFMLYELYRDDAALDAHRRTPHFLEYSPKMQDLTETRETELFNHIAAPAMNQLTRPSGHGPRWPIDQPPASSGCFA